MRGMGMSFAFASERTIRYSSGASCSVTGLDRVVAMATLSENQYIEKLNTRPRARAMNMPFVPQMLPIRTKSPPRAAISTQVLTLFTFVRLLRLGRSEEHTSELQSHHDLVCRLLLEK